MHAQIQRSANGRVVFTLSGRIEVEDVKELQELLASEKRGEAGTDEHDDLKFEDDPTAVGGTAERK